MSQQEYGFIVRKIKFEDFTVLFRSKCLSVGSANRGDSARASSLAASYLGRFREPVGHKSVGKVANIFGTTSLEAEDVQDETGQTIPSIGNEASIAPRQGSRSKLLEVSNACPIDTRASSWVDGTGLLVWPGCRELATYLVHPLGARQHYWRELSGILGRCSKRATILELGAGTGICGIVAAMATKRPVILTDRCDDVIDNLRQSVRLNGLEKRVQVARLAWGSGKKRDPELPAEIREHAPFKIIIASDTLYTGSSEGFFAIVRALLDPSEGVLLLSYVPRPPSLATENMLRCAYRAGLRGRRLDNGCWSSAIGSNVSHGGTRRRPVILEFRLSAKLSPLCEHRTISSAKAADGDGKKVEDRRVTEASWILEWKSMFPEGVHFKPIGAEPSSRATFATRGSTSGNGVHASSSKAGRKEDEGDDAVTAEELWGDCGNLQAPWFCSRDP